MIDKKIKRRKFFAQSGVGALALSVAPAAAITACASTSNHIEEEEDGQVLFIGEDIAVASTAYGKVKGYIMKGIYTFHGIPYADDASGKNRFMPPQEPRAWDGIRPAVFYGNSAPQKIYDRSPESYYAFVDQWNYDEVSEDCLRLNIWTPGIADGMKRPVVVWLHGGRFSNGNGIEQDGYHGENFSRYGDVVFCSINHRLGPIGFSDFSAVGGEAFKDSGNVGLLDIIAALKWVNKNIANFGGDPNNVTVMGQSGGGDKVCLVAAMPEAKGLVHKAVALSGFYIKGMNKAYSQDLGRYILQEAGITISQIHQLQEMPWQDYIDLALRAEKRMEKEKGSSGMRFGSFGPQADGVHIPLGEFYNSTDKVPDIPMLMCTTFHEWTMGRTEPELEDITLEGVIRELQAAYGNNAEEIVHAYAENFPNSKPIEIWALIRSNRQRVVSAAKAKLKQKSPLYVAWFGWSSPLFDYRMRSFHCLDISFWFLNTDLMVTHTGGGARPRKLSKKMADALLSFMRTGNPNGVSALPHWPAYTTENGETMILNDECNVANDPDKIGRSVLDKYSV